MRSVSSEAAPARPAGRLTIAGTAILLAAITAGSTATAAFILGLSRLPLVGFLGAVTVAALALSRWRVRWALPLSLLVGIPISLMVAGWDPWQAPSHSLRQLHAMLGMIERGAAGDTTFPDFLFFLGFWGNAAWLGWLAIRAWRPLIAMVPSVAIIVTNVLNVPQGQATYVLGLVLCCCTLLLVTAYERSVSGARSRGIWLHDDVRWNFWEMGVAVSVLVLAITAFAPPVSTVDRTLTLQNTLFPGAGTADSRSGQPGQTGAAVGAGTVIGYSRMVRLLGPLQRSNQIVFTYTSNLSFPGPYYFAGDTATNPAEGAWVPADGSDETGVLNKNTQLPWQVPVQQQLSTQFEITMQRPQQAGPRTIFYPGQLQQATIPTELQLRYGVAPENVVAVDQAQDAEGVPQRYQVTVGGSTATAQQLSAAGTDYPSWVRRYAQPLETSYLPRSVLNKIHTLAVQAIAVSQADPYDEATAIQNYLRANFGYTMTPRPVPQGEDAVEAFLNHQTGGYCVYFATVMADMLRSLGVPVILVNGFGPGTFNPATGRFVVRASDAHTWPEVYFPSYGWISFEPTPQNGYAPIPRGGTTIGCPSDICGSGAAAGGLGNQNPIAGRGQVNHGSGASLPQTTHRARFPWIWPVLGGLGLLILAALVLFAWWLRPPTLAASWRRTLRLSQVAGIPADPSESPREFGRRLGQAVPALAQAAQVLADEVTIAAYAPPGTGPPGSAPAGKAWRTIRTHLLRAALRRGLRRSPTRAAA